MANKTRELGNLTTNNLFSTDVSNGRLGIGSTTPSVTLDVVGIVSATSFTGNLTGNVTGNLTGNVTGNVTGNLTGEVNAAAFDTSESGVIVTGIATASGFSGPLTGDVTGTATTATSLSGTPDIIVGVVTASSLIVSGNVSIGGTLTYEDVTNIDSVGIITARTGIIANGFKIEEGQSDSSTSLTGTFNFDFENGHIHRYSAATSGNYVPNFRISASTTLDSKMNVGDVTSATLIVASSSHYIASPASIQIDGSSANIDVDWLGGSAPSSASGSGYDIYAFTIIKTAATPAYHIISNAIAAA